MLKPENLDVAREFNTTRGVLPFDEFDKLRKDYSTVARETTNSS